MKELETSNMTNKTHSVFQYKRVQEGLTGLFLRTWLLKGDSSRVFLCVARLALTTSALSHMSRPSTAISATFRLLNALTSLPSDNAVITNTTFCQDKY